MVFLVLTACCRCRVIANIALDKEVRLGWFITGLNLEVVCLKLPANKLVLNLEWLTSWHS